MWFFLAGFDLDDGYTYIFLSLRSRYILFGLGTLLLGVTLSI